MSDLLFDLPESKSPRLQWMEKYGFRTHQFKPGETVCGVPWSGWAAVIPFTAEGTECTVLDLLGIWSREPGLFLVGIGETENEAIYDLAARNKIRLWNETP